MPAARCSRNAAVKLSSEAKQTKSSSLISSALPFAGWSDGFLATGLSILNRRSSISDVVNTSEPQYRVTRHCTDWISRNPCITLFYRANLKCFVKSNRVKVFPVGSLDVGFIPIWSGGSPNQHLPYRLDQEILGAMSVNDLWLVFFPATEQ